LFIGTHKGVWFMVSLIGHFVLMFYTSLCKLMHLADASILLCTETTTSCKN